MQIFLFAMMQRKINDDIVNVLVEKAKENGGFDNITAIVIDPFNEEVD